MTKHYSYTSTEAEKCDKQYVIKATYLKPFGYSPAGSGELDIFESSYIDLENMELSKTSATLFTKEEAELFVKECPMEFKDELSIVKKGDI